MYAVLELRFATTIIPGIQFESFILWRCNIDDWKIADLDAMVPFVYPPTLILVTSLCGVAITLLIWVRYRISLAFCLNFLIWIVIIIVATTTCDSSSGIGFIVITSFTVHYYYYLLLKKNISSFLIFDVSLALLIDTSTSALIGAVILTGIFLFLTFFYSYKIISIDLKGLCWHCGCLQVNSNLCNVTLFFPFFFFAIW